MNGLADSDSLLSLDISRNKLTSKHSSMLSSCVLNSNLEILNLSQNNLDDEFCEHIGELLKGF